MKDGIIYGDLEYIKPYWEDDDKMLESYGWLLEKMKEKLGKSPISNGYPIWAWY